MRHFISVIACFPAMLAAATFDAPTVPLENDAPAMPPIHLTPHAPQTDDKPSAEVEADINVPSLNEQDLLANPTLLESLITQAIQNKNAAFLADLLTVYQRLPETQMDATLLDYAQSALLHMQGKTAQAIALQEKLLHQNPDAAYIRMNTAMMQLEDKRYGDAMENLQILANQSDKPELQHIATQHLQHLKPLTEWQFGGHLQYDQNNNVNNASSERGVTINGVYWQKNADSLPKTAHGLRYGLSASRLWLLSGNHALLTSASVNGRHYWDRSEYSRHSIQTSVGHLYQNKNWLFRTTPTVSHTWLGGERYAHDVGISHSITYRINPNWRVQLSPSIRRTHYHAESNRDFNSINTAIAPTVYYDNQHFHTYFGLYYARNRAAKESLSSHAWQMRGGVSHTWPSLVGISLDGAYGQERYDRAPELRITPYPFRRHDRTWQVNVSVWRPSWQYRGFMPKLNFSQQNIISNMPAFYSRQHRQLFLNVEKVF